jgi:hypothetical protein
VDSATLEKIRNLRDVAAQLRTRADQMCHDDYVARMLKGARELEVMASCLETEADPANAPERLCA